MKKFKLVEDKFDIVMIAIIVSGLIIGLYLV